MKEEKVTTFNEFGEKLVGLETPPSINRNKYPAVILVHGFGVTKSEYGMFDDLANNLSENGFLVYRFDFSGCGESEGDYSETSLSKLKSDLSKILDFVKSQKKVDISRIGIHAQSFGTATSVALEPKIQSLIMTGSISHPKEVISKLCDNECNFDGISTRTKSDGKIIKIRPKFWKDFENYNLIRSIKKINCPILFIHGSKDENVPISEMEAYFRNANEPKEKVILEGADHGLEPGREKMYQIAISWFSKWLK
jgi:dipeptidyl aminopeptidase/acylaminoacyl peptidase